MARHDREADRASDRRTGPKPGASGPEALGLPSPISPLEGLRRAIAAGRLPAPPDQRLARALGLPAHVDRVEPDYEAAGLLDGLDGPQRKARLGLLRQLSDAGVTLARIEQASSEGRLAMLTIEHLFGADAKYTVEEAAERARVDPKLLHRIGAALGLPPETEAAVFSEGDIDGMRAIDLVLATGISEERALALVRVAGRAAAQTAQAVFEVLSEAFLRSAEAELEIGLRTAELNDLFMPLFASAAEIPLRLHLRELVRQELVDRAEAAGGSFADAQEVSIAFADLVDFTGLSDRVPLAQLATLADRFDAHCVAVASSPVRLVKLIGDAGMFVSPEVMGLVDAMARLLRLVAEDDLLPQLRAGIASGPALRRGGDWYGSTVNLAARIASTASAGDAAATDSVVRATSPGQTWRPLGPHQLKGIPRPVDLFALELR